MVSNDLSPLAGLTPGDPIVIQGKHADGSVYRWWTATIEAVGDTEITVVWPVSTLFGASDPEKQRRAQRRGRAHFWRDRFYDLIEAYDADGELGAIFADVCAPVVLENGRLVYVDHELDVVKYRGEAAFAEDEDEFEEAAQMYGYSLEFQQHCRRVTAELVAIVERWVPGESPEFGDESPAAESGPVSRQTWP